MTGHSPEYRPPDIPLHAVIPLHRYCLFARRSACLSVRLSVCLFLCIIDLSVGRRSGRRRRRRRRRCCLWDGLWVVSEPPAGRRSDPRAAASSTLRLASGPPPPDSASTLTARSDAGPLSVLCRMRRPDAQTDTQCRAVRRSRDAVNSSCSVFTIDRLGLSQVATSAVAS